MDFLENALDKAKETLDVVSKKTSEVISTQKQKFDLLTIKNKRSKDFEKLGEIYFNLIKDDNIIEIEEIRILVDSILEKNDLISKLEDEINNA
jgi:hypothetical protein